MENFVIEKFVKYLTEPEQVQYHELFVTAGFITLQPLEITAAGLDTCDAAINRLGTCYSERKKSPLTKSSINDDIIFFMVNEKAASAQKTIEMVNMYLHDLERSGLQFSSLTGLNLKQINAAKCFGLIDKGSNKLTTTGECYLLALKALFGLSTLNALTMMFEECPLDFPKMDGRMHLSGINLFLTYEIVKLKDPAITELVRCGMLQRTRGIVCLTEAGLKQINLLWERDIRPSHPFMRASTAVVELFDGVYVEEPIHDKYLAEIGDALQKLTSIEKKALQDVGTACKTEEGRMVITEQCKPLAIRWYEMAYSTPEDFVAAGIVAQTFATDAMDYCIVRILSTLTEQELCSLDALGLVDRQNYDMTPAGYDTVRFIAGNTLVEGPNQLEKIIKLIARTPPKWM